MSRTDAVDLSRDPPSADNPQVDVSGDPSGGFIVSIHDGEKLHTFAPVAGDEDAARRLALDEWMRVRAASKPRSAPASADLGDLVEKLKAELVEHVAALKAELADHFAKLKDAASG